MSNTSYVLILILLVLLSAFFSATETAFSSLNRIKLKYLMNNGNKEAEETLKLAENYPKLLSTVLVGNNIVNIVSATLATVFFTKLIQENGALISSILMTIIVIIFGEICPKRIAKSRPESFAIAVTPVVTIIAVLLSPITYLLNKFGDIIEKLFTKEEEIDFSSEELVTMVEEAEEQGDMDEDEADLITNAIEFNDQDVGEIYTPRVDVIACSNSDSMDEIEKKFRETGYSRLPYFKDSIDNITGVIHEKDFYQIYFKKSNKSIDDILQKVIYTNENVKASNVLRQLQKEKCHLAVVVDEYGGTEGIITMEDILEELVGEIYDEHDEVIEYFKKIKENTYLVNCDADIEDLFDFLEIKIDTDQLDYNTVSGWVIDEMNKIPVNGDSFSCGDLKVTVTNADEKEVKEVKIERILSNIID